ncbi:hypothetical protein LINPERPRIM_LOCUS4825, partial [Linum perenne]
PVTKLSNLEGVFCALAIEDSSLDLDKNELYVSLSIGV